MTRVPQKRDDIARWLLEAEMADRSGNAAVIAGLNMNRSVGIAGIHRKVFDFTAVAIPMLDAAGVIAYKGTKLFTFPKGVMKILGASIQGVTGKTSTGINATFRLTFGVGTVTAANDATLSGTEQNIIPSTTMAAAAAGVGAIQGANAADIAPLEGSTTAAEIWLNTLINDADHDVTTTPASLTISGQMVLAYVDLGTTKP